MAQVGTDQNTPGPRRAPAKNPSRRRSDTIEPSRSNAHDEQPVQLAQPDGESHSPGDAFATRAYELYLQRGGGDGQDLDDWLQAERELKAE